MVFVFAMVTMVNANSNTNDKVEESISAIGCHQAAWNYGTTHGHGDPYWEWYYTNQYFNTHCVQQE